jgi:hypothetical protein
MLRPKVDRAPARECTRVCAFCGEPFVAVRPHQRFHRPSCRWAYRREGPRHRRLPLEELEDGLVWVPFE